MKVTSTVVLQLYNFLFFFLRAELYMVAIRSATMQFFSAVLNTKSFIFGAHPQLIRYFLDVERLAI